MNTNMEIELIISASPLYNIAEAFTKLWMALEEARERINNFNYTYKNCELEYIIDGEEEEIEIEKILPDKNIWEEMSYNCYCQGMLEYDPTDEYANGDWNME